MKKLSVVISAYNEAERIEKCLKSTIFADEIIFIDNQSTDDTVKIAKKYTSKIFSQKNDPFAIDLLKNTGFEKAESDWILSIDADEEISKELSEEIRNILKRGPSEDGFWIPRKNYMFGKWIKENTGWYPDYQLRLFRKGKGKFLSKHVHEDIKLDGTSGKLKNHIVHNNYDNIIQFIRKIMIYAPNEAENKLKNGYKFSHFDVIRLPVGEFLSWFFSRKGYRDGFHGLVLSLLMSFYHLITVLFIWEKQGFNEYGGGNFIKDLAQEFKKSEDEISHWINKEQEEEKNNPFKETFRKIRNSIKV